MSSDTRSTLIEIATGQVRRQGYAGFSYAHLASLAGIRKPSIHHHFPLKEDLGVAIVKAYTEQFSGRLDDIETRKQTAIDRLRAYGALYREAVAAGHACLCGVLASETAILPESLQDAVRQFFQLQLRWLERSLKGGASEGSLRSDVQPRQEARTILATLQGAMFIALSLEEPASFDQALAGLLQGLTRQPR